MFSWLPSVFNAKPTGTAACVPKNDLIQTTRQSKDSKQVIISDITPSDQGNVKAVQHILSNNNTSDLHVTEESRKALKEAKKRINEESAFRENNNILVNIPDFDHLNDEQLKQL